MNSSVIFDPTNGTFYGTAKAMAAFAAAAMESKQTTAAENNSSAVSFKTNPYTGHVSACPAADTSAQVKKLAKKTGENQPESRANLESSEDEDEKEKEENSSSVSDAREMNPPTSYAEVLNTPSANPPTVNTTKDEEETPLTEEERFRQDVRKVLVRLKQTSTDARIRALVRNTQEYYKRTGKTWHSKVCRFGTEKCRDRNNCPHLHDEAEDVVARALIRRYSENPMFAKELCDPLPGKVCKDSVNCQFRHPELGDRTPPPRRAKKL